MYLRTRNHSTAAHFAAQNNHGHILKQFKELLRDYKIALSTCAMETTEESDLEAVRAKHGELASQASTGEELKRLTALSNIFTKQVQEGKRKIDKDNIDRLSEKELIDTMTLSGLRPIHLAAENDCVDALQGLLSYNHGPANVSSNESYVSTLTNRTSSTLSEKVIIDVNAVDNSGETPLHKAGRNKNFVTYKLLIAAGAMETVQNIAKLTPKQLLIDDFPL